MRSITTDFFSAAQGLHVNRLSVFFINAQISVYSPEGAKKCSSGSRALVCVSLGHLQVREDRWSRSPRHLQVREDRCATPTGR